MQLPHNDHNIESQSIQNLNQIFNHSASKSMQRNVSLNLKSIENQHQKRALIQEGKQMIDVPQVEPMPNTTPIQNANNGQHPFNTMQPKNASTHSINNFEYFQMKAKLVTRKPQVNLNSKNQGLSTDDQQTTLPKKKRLNASIGHVYEYSVDGAPKQIMAA